MTAPLLKLIEAVINSAPLWSTDNERIAAKKTAGMVAIIPPSLPPTLPAMMEAAVTAMPPMTKRRINPATDIPNIKSSSFLLIL